MRFLATVLYEDSPRGGQVKEFGLHNFVCAAVADEVGRPLPEIRHLIAGVPKKGNGKVLAACRNDLGALTACGGPVFAVVDLDQAHRLVKLPPNSCKRELVDAFADGCSPPELLRVVLLDKNLESVLRALQDCDPQASESADAYHAAIDRKRLNKRDQLLNRFAWGRRADRDCVLAAAPSLARLVKALAEVVPSACDSA